MRGSTSHGWGLRRAFSNLGFKALFLFSPSQRIENVLVTVLAPGEGGAEDALTRVGSALSLLRSRHEVGHRQVQRYLDRIVVTTTHGSLAWYWHNLRACFLDPVHVAEAAPAELAMTLVHETTHARIRQRGIEWDRDCRPRVEAICIRAEIQLASSIPGGGELRDQAVNRRLRELARGQS